MLFQLTVYFWHHVFWIVGYCSLEMLAIVCFDFLRTLDSIKSTLIGQYFLTSSVSPDLKTGVIMSCFRMGSHW